ncbi:putative elongation factor 1-gamma [Cardiosporidium cionae]|uniref:Elongation factor 1-gamma n=1 Tax=Cardiosporidium cionae TaxID=476202 RepID=A0ABQ7J996_9APIC|nr:putative elongation factor 1-gamma [Cardiosporidium cionae]|eukprot:KAF8820531.1 putative elongation factor 1-gamma [Cardiosporidium cionae]
MKLYAPKDSTSSLRCLVAASYAGVTLPLVEWKAGCVDLTDTIAEHYTVVLETLKGPLGGGDAIFRYLGRIRPEASLYGETLQESAEVDMWLQFSAELEHNLFPDASSPSMNEAVIQESLIILNHFFLNSTYLVGENVTLADIAIGITLYQAKLVGKLSNSILSKYENLQRWLNTITSQRQFLKIVEKEEPKKKEPVPRKAVASTATAAKAKQNGTVEEEDVGVLSIPLLDRWKKTYSNTKNIKDEAMPWFWENIFATGEYSLWFMRYNKLPAECKMDFLTCNLCNGFMQRMNNSIRSESFGVINVMGEGGEFDIEGVWLFTGSEMPALMKEHPSYEYQDFIQLDPQNAADKQRIIDYWCETETIQGRPIVDTHAWK